MDPKQFDRVRVVMTAAQNILEAAENDRATVSQLLAKLQRLEEKVDRSLAEIPSTIDDSLNSLASATAQSAADQLCEKFVDANKAADKATQQFEAAGRNILRKYWLALTVSQVVFALILLTGAYCFIPSKEEIASRQNQYAELKRSIDALNTRKR